MATCVPHARRATTSTPFRHIISATARARAAAVPSAHRTHVTACATLRHEQTTSDHDDHCWQCGRDDALRKLLCSLCGALQAPRYASLFEVFELPADQYHIDKPALQETFHQMQKVLHPDLFTTKPQEEQRISATYSAIVNDAFRTLSDDTKRAVYMLEQRGVSLGEDETCRDQRVLFDVLEAREALEHADAAEAAELLAECVQRLRALGDAFADALARGDLDAGKEEASKMMYFSKLCNDIHAELPVE